MLGLDAAGKTSELKQNDVPLSNAFTAILYKLKLNQSVTTIPTGRHFLFLSVTWLTFLQLALMWKL